jgi:hypothetical protein
MVDQKTLHRRLHKLHDRVYRVERALLDTPDIVDHSALRLELGQIAIGVMHIMTDLDQLPAATIIDVAELTSPGIPPLDTDEFD